MKARMPAGFGRPDMNALMRQAQKMQEDMKAKQAELEAAEYTGSASGEMVTVKMNGKHEVLAITIKPEAVDPDDIEMLEELVAALGNRRVTICRELTKKHETAFLTTLEDALEYYRQEDPRGECVIVMEGRSRREMIEEKQRAWEEMSLEEHMKIYEDQGIGRKDAMKMVAKDRGISKREVYQGLLD